MVECLPFFIKNYFLTENYMNSKKCILSLIPLAFLLSYCTTFFAYTNRYVVNITRNTLGIDPEHFQASYDSLQNHVVITSVDLLNPSTLIIPNVYVRRLTSDPRGINFIGTIPNPLINPGHPYDFTSYRDIYEIYSSKY
jgi:hypothetical protein